MRKKPAKCPDGAQWTPPRKTLKHNLTKSQKDEMMTCTCSCKAPVSLMTSSNAFMMSLRLEAEEKKKAFNNIELEYFIIEKFFTYYATG